MFWMSADVTQSGSGPAVPFGGLGQRLHVHTARHCLEKTDVSTQVMEELIRGTKSDRITHITHV